MAPRTTGVLLVGGASRRFGSPKALAQIDGETLAARAWRLLGDVCETRIAVGKTADDLELPFDVIDDGTEVRAALAGMVAGLRAAEDEVALILPIDCPNLTSDALAQLAAACRDVAVSQTGPLPGAYRRSALPVLERRLREGSYRLRDALAELDVATVNLPAELLLNVNTPQQLPYATATVEVARHPGGIENDLVAVEEPLELRIAGEPVAITMRTPGHDEELALGFAIGEGLDPVDATLPADLAGNTVELDVRAFDLDRLKRHFYTSSSCGVCGKGALEAVAVHAPPVSSDLRVDAALVATLPDRLRKSQPTFAATGGIHATGLFDAAGELLCVREDVGRHNALDKVIGWAFRAGRLPLTESILCVSGRLSFELVQKASAAGCPVLVGVGAPTSLAVDLARSQNVTLCGWARRDRMTSYAHGERLRLSEPAHG